MSRHDVGDTQWNYLLIKLAISIIRVVKLNTFKQKNK